MANQDYQQLYPKVKKVPDTTATKNNINISNKKKYWPFKVYLFTHFQLNI